MHIDMAHIGYFRLLQTSVALVYSSLEVARAFQQVLGGFGTTRDTSAQTYTIDHRPQTNDYIVYAQNDVIAKYTSLDHLITGLEWILINKAIADSSTPILHAAAVTLGPHTLLLPGQSGAGKTTLALALILNDWQLLSDELVPINPSSGTIGSFHRVLCLKNKTVDHLKTIDAHNILHDTVFPINDVSVVSPCHFARASSDKDYPITHIVFPHYAQGESPHLRLMEKSEALVKLTACISNRGQLTQRNFDAIAKNIRQIPCHELQSGNLEQTLETLQALCLRQ